MNPGERAGEEAFQRIKRRINRIYGNARREIEGKLEEHTRKFRAEDAKKRQALLEGRITQDEYDRWVRLRVWQGEQWQDKLDSVTTTLADANESALRIVNGERVGVFAENATYQNFLADQHGIAGVWDIYDQATVSNLLAENPRLLPPKRLDRAKDKAWNRRQINNCILQGILQGEDIRAIAKRMAVTTGSTNRKQMLRTARTAMTAAQNAGRVEAMHYQQSLGIRVKKLWIATLDSRTRDAHQALDGQKADVDEPFESELGDIMFPGDPAANPANVYNCRCTLGYDYPDFPMENATRYDQENGEQIEYETYQEWKREWQLVDGGNDTGETLIVTEKPQQPEREPEKKTPIPENPYGDEMETKGYVGLSGAESDSFIAEHHNAKIIGKHGANTMIGAQSSRINKALREGEMPTLPEDLKMVEKLDAAIQENKLPEDMTLFRGCPISMFVDTKVFEGLAKPSVDMGDYVLPNGRIDYDAWRAVAEREERKYESELLERAQGLRGLVVKDNGFMQVSASSERNIYKFSDVDLQIHAPAGMNCYISDYKEESEIILPRGTKLKIVDVRMTEVTASNGQKKNVLQVIAEVVDD